MRGEPKYAMKNFNEYNADKFAKGFKNTEIYRKICNDFDVISFFKFYQDDTSREITARQYFGDKYIQRLFHVQTFYFLDFLLEKNPETIYDLGCGWNIFKKYIPNIIGIGAEDINSKSFYGDIHDYVDDDFIKGHQNYFESVFSVNALHFRPLRKFSKIINDFYSMIAPGGRGYLALNLARMIEKDPLFMPNATRQEYDQYCRSELKNLVHIDLLAIDIDFKYLDDVLDGNIKLVMEKS